MISDTESLNSQISSGSNNSCTNYQDASMLRTSLAMAGKINWINNNSKE